MPKPLKYKRHGPKSTRAGCLLCKPHKRQGCGHERHGDRRRAGDPEEFLNALLSLSNESLARIWDNPLDAEYDEP